MTRKFIALLAPFFLSMAACSLSSSSTNHVVISMPPGGFQPTARSAATNIDALLASPARRAQTAGSSNGNDNNGGFPMPTGLSDFTCFAVLVTGSGILNDPGMQSQCGPNLNGVPVQIGIIGGFAPVSGGTIDVQVPSGAGRLVRLLAIQSDGSCPNIDAMLAQMVASNQSGPNNNNSGNNGPNLGNPYEIARTQVDTFADQSVDMTASFDPSTAQPAFQCGNGNNNGGGNNAPPILSGLSMFPHNPTSGNPIRVMGSMQNNANQVGLYSDAACTVLIPTSGWNSGPNSPYFNVTANPPGRPPRFISWRRTRLETVRACPWAAVMSTRPMRRR